MAPFARGVEDLADRLADFIAERLGAKASDAIAHVRGQDPGYTSRAYVDALVALRRRGFWQDANANWHPPQDRPPEPRP